MDCRAHIRCDRTACIGHGISSHPIGQPLRGSTSGTLQAFTRQHGLQSGFYGRRSILSLSSEVIAAHAFANASCTYDGKLYGLPYMTDTRVLFYNKDHFRAAGLDPENPPKTWDEVLEYTKKLNLTDENGEPTQVGFSTVWWEIAPWTMGWTFGADYWDADGNPTLDTPEMLEALNYVKELTAVVGEDAFQKLYDASMATGVSPFTNGTVSMCIQFNGFCSTLETYAPDLDYGVALIPTKDGVNYKSSWGAGYGLEFTHKSDARAQAAFELGQYLVSTEVATKFLLGNSEYVCNMEAYENPQIQNDPIWQVFAESGKYTRIHHFCPELPTWPNSVLVPEWQAALLGTKTPEQALADAQANLLQEIENYHLINGD